MSTFMGNQHPRDLIGKQFGQYRLESLLGTGETGQVFRGVHLQLGRPVAVKVLFSDLVAHPDLVTRFHQEARSVAALHHLHLMEIYEFGEEEGMLYLTMELMSEHSLASLLRLHADHRLPLPLVLDLARQVAAGLAVAHARHIVHRDIKPANLLLRHLPDIVSEAGSYLLKISDFDLAHVLEGGARTLTSVSMTALAYMSPEQCTGQPLSELSDLYSLGIVLYEMVAGQPPFQITSSAEAIHKHALLPPPSLRATLSEVPESVEALILRCLAKRPTERFASAGDLVAALERELGDSKRIPNLATAPLTVLTRTPTNPRVPVEVSSPVSLPTMPLPASAPTGGTSLVALASTCVRLVVTPRILLIVPGQQANLQIDLTNTGPKVDWFTLSVEGVPAEWVRGADQEVPLNPGAQETVMLAVLVERKPLNRARDYLVSIRVRSRKNPQEFSLSNVTWMVQPFKEEIISLQPRKVIGRGQANYTLGMYNGSNVPNRYILRGDDREQQLVYEFQASAVELDAGQEVQMPVKVHARRRWFGQQ